MAQGQFQSPYQEAGEGKEEQNTLHLYYFILQLGQNANIRLVSSACHNSTVLFLGRSNISIWSVCISVCGRGIMHFSIKEAKTF